MKDIIGGDWSVLAPAYAATGTCVAEEVHPLLRETLTVSRGPHAGGAPKGLANVAGRRHALHDQLQGIAKSTHPSAQVVHKAHGEAL
ncbi:MAG: hypothetical protein ACUVTG_03790 [Candidatus Oleimicrobiaceae bacterium]